MAYRTDRNDAATAITDLDTAKEGLQIEPAGGRSVVWVRVTAEDGETTLDYRVRLNKGSDADFEWNLLKDIDDLASGNDAPAGVWSNGTTMWVLDADDGSCTPTRSPAAPPTRRTSALHADNANASDIWWTGPPSGSPTPRQPALRVHAGGRRAGRDAGLRVGAAERGVEHVRDGHLVRRLHDVGRRRRRRPGVRLLRGGRHDARAADSGGVRPVDRPRGLRPDRQARAPSSRMGSRGASGPTGRRCGWPTRRRQAVRLPAGERGSGRGAGVRHPARRRQPRPPGHLVRRRDDVGGERHLRRRLPLHRHRQQAVLLQHADAHRRDAEQPDADRLGERRRRPHSGALRRRNLRSTAPRSPTPRLPR